MPLNFLPLAIIVILLAPQLSAILDPIESFMPDTSPGIKKFNSTKEISEYLKNNMVTRSSGYLYDAAPEINILAGVSEKSVQSIIPQVTGDYSTTNVQVAGVDEADFVKNDGRYIYIIANNRLVIVDAYPADQAKIISETTFDGTAGDLFLNGNELVVFTTEYNYRITAERKGIISRIFGIAADEVAPRYGGQVTHALVYSLKNKANPVLQKDICVDGTFFNARMIGDHVYLVTKEQIYYYNDPLPVPMISEGGDKWTQPDVYYFNNPETSYVFHTVTSFNVNGGTGVKSKTFLMGATNTMYVSEDNIYISYPVYNNYVVPVTRSPGIFGNGPFGAIEDAFNQLTDREKEEILSDARVGTVKPSAYTTRTVIHKLAIDRGNVEYAAKGEVPGTLLDQFALDEDNGKLRVATTVNTYGGSAPYMYNCVYVLDGGMKEIGSLEKIAPDEKIYSTRFMGDRLYMVTFKQMDPFFVIDLADPNRPKVLGALKIPGYSDYLHPYDATHIIGIGKETVANQWGGVSAKGLKVALFDVSDVENPKLVDKFEIGDAGTDSEALRDHRAVLFDKAKNILVIPVREVGYVQVMESGKSYSSYKYRDAAYVFGISPAKGIDIKGVVAHSDDGSYDTVKRSLFIGDILYTVSGQKIVMSDLNDLKEPLGEIALSYSYYPVLYD